MGQTTKRAEALKTATQVYSSTSPAQKLYRVPPPLKWAGGKRWQIPHLRAFWEPQRDRRLVEPFCGGLSVALGLLPERALLNDLNPYVISFYRWLKRGLTVSIEMENESLCYYRQREKFNALRRLGKVETKEVASLFYYLNRTGYNGLCRFNLSGEFNVPFGRYKKINYRRNFLDYRPIVANWEFLNTSFEQIHLERDDFIYADPPYDVEFTEYSKGGFSWEQQVHAAELLARHKGPVVLSNQATPRIVDLYSNLGYRLIYLQAPRRISCTGDRTPASEVLALRNV
jgi:DNA adenine methylase